MATKIKKTPTKKPTAKWTLTKFLTVARDKVLKGWCKNDYGQDSKGQDVEKFPYRIKSEKDLKPVCKVCLAGALYFAKHTCPSRNNEFKGRLFQTAYNTVGEVVRERSTNFGLENFNDDPRTRKAQVVRVLNLAIEIAKNDKAATAA